MSDFTEYLKAVSIADSVSTITGKSSDAYVSGGYAAFVQALTGSMPKVIKDGKYARILLTEAQSKIIRKWVESQMLSFAKPKDSFLDIQIGAVTTPLLLKYVLPAAVLLIAAGWLACHVSGR